MGLMMAGTDECIKRSIMGDIMPKDNTMGVFLSLKLIQYKSNTPFIDRYSWILAFCLLHKFFFCKALNWDLAIVNLDFFIQIACFLRKLWSFHILLLFTSLKSSSIYLSKSSWNNSHKLLFFQSYFSYIMTVLAIFLATDSWVFSIFFSFLLFCVLLIKVKSVFRRSIFDLVI